MGGWVRARACVSDVCVMCVHVCVRASRHHSQVLRPKRPKFGVWSPSSRENIINHMWVW